MRRTGARARCKHAAAPTRWAVIRPLRQRRKTYLNTGGARFSRAFHASFIGGGIRVMVAVVWDMEIGVSQELGC